MYRDIFPYKYAKTEDVNDGIRRALSQLKKYNFAIVTDPRISRALSRSFPKHFRESGTVIFSKNLNQVKVITIQPNYKLHEITPKKWKLIFQG